MTPGRSAALAREMAPQLVSAGAEREITVDRSNDCVVVDEAVFVKWLTPPVPHGDADLLAHLQQVGFTQTPQLFGVSHEDGALIALVFEYIAGASDGWEWFFEEVLSFADEHASEAEVLCAASRIGALAADLHIAFSARSEIMPTSLGMVNGKVERDRCRTLLDVALAEVSASEHPEACGALAACRPAITELIEAMPDDRTPALRIHGDLHLGNFLRAGERLVVIDFEGNPLAGGRHRPKRRPAAVDVASVVQSIDHAVRMAQHRRPGNDAMFDALASRLTEHALSAYREQLARSSLANMLDGRLLPALRAGQELHELVYAVRRLPRWIYAPILALRGMFPEAFA
jgi:maltokinase